MEETKSYELIEEWKNTNNNLKDQGFARPKTLILLPFKGVAFKVISHLLLLLNGGRWKKISKGKKFRDEYSDEEEEFNDFFRIGISVREGRVKVYEQFYKSDIIIGKSLPFSYSSFATWSAQYHGSGGGQRDKAELRLSDKH